MTTPTTYRSTPAITTAVIGLVCLVAGAVWPWFGSPGGPFGSLPAPWLLWANVAGALAVLLTLLLAPRTPWPLILAGLVVVLAIATRASADPGWMCWDGVDAEGNMVGGCEDDRWTPAVIAFAVGVALSVAAAVLGRLAARRASRPPVSAAV